LPASGGRGIAVPLSEHQPLAPRAFAEQLAALRRLGCQLPVEVWEAGDELSAGSREMLSRLEGVRVRNLDDYLPNARNWRGFQIKGAIPRFTTFDELLLADADIVFASNPERFFETPEFRESGTYFFRDEQSNWRFFGKPKKECRTCHDVKYYRQRKGWLRVLLGVKMPVSVPPEWAYHWEEGEVVNATMEVMDSGVVLLDRRRHSGLVRELFRLNDDSHRNETYKHVYGDKETFWLAAVLAREPFALHAVEAAHECCSLLAYATIAHSAMWRSRVILTESGGAERGTALQGLVQRFPNGRAIYYHRKALDVPPLSPFVLDRNAELCSGGWAGFFDF